MGLVRAPLSLPGRYRATRRLMAVSDAPLPPPLPLTIPGWGVLREGPGGLFVQPRSRLPFALGGLVKGYFVACFIALPPVGLLVMLLGVQSMGPIRLALAAAAVTGLVNLARRLSPGTRRARVTFDTAARTLLIDAPDPGLSVPFDRIESWRVRSVSYPGGLNLNGETLWLLVLVACTTDGRETPVHAFTVNFTDREQTELIVRRTQTLLAKITGTQFRRRGLYDSNDEKTPTTAPGKMVTLVQGLLAILRGDARYRNLE